MAAQERIAMIETGFQKELESSKMVQSEIEAKLQTVELLKQEHEAEVKAAEEKGFEQGLEQAGQAGGDDKIYSDAELNAELQPLRDEIASLKSQLEAMKLENETLKVDLEAAKSAQVDEEKLKADAVAAFKVELKQKYDEQQVAETQGETGFASMLA